MSVLEHLEMHVRTGRTSGTAHTCDELTFLHDVSGLDEQFMVMPVARNVAGAVIDFDHPTVTVAFTGERHDTGCNRNHIGVLLARKVRPRMPCHTAGDRI